MSEYKYDRNQLLEETNGGLDIIRRLYPECEKGQKFVHFKLREEQTASANVFRSGEIYLVKDHGTGEVFNAIDLVMQSESLSFSEACKWVAQEFSVNGNSPVFNRPQLEFKKATRKQRNGDYLFKYKDFTDQELAVLGPLVTPEICAKFNLKSCESFTQIKQYKDHPTYGNDLMQIITKSNENYPIFVFDFGDWQKIYQPLNQDKQYRFRYVGNKPKDFVLGLEDLEKRYKELEPVDEEDRDPKLEKVIIAGGDRDALNVASLDYPVVWLNSESAKLSYATYKLLTDRAKNIYYLGDIDETGVKESIKLALEYIHIKIIWLPQWLRKFSYRGKPRKDFKDFVDYTYSKNDPEKLEREFRTLLNDALPARFWDAYPQKNKPTKYTFNNEAAYRFLQYHGFYRFEEETAKEDFSFIRIKDGIVKRVKYHHLANFPGEYLKRKKKPIDLLNFIHRSGQLTEKSLAKLDLKEIDFSDCSYDHQLLFFKNSIWKVTKDGITEHKYGDNNLKAYVWEDKIIPHQVKVNKDPAFRITHDGSRYDIEILRNDNHFLNYLINTSRVHWRKCGDVPFNLKLKSIQAETQEEREQKERAIEKERLEYKERNRFNIAEEGLTAEEIQEQKEHLINKIFAYGYLLHKQKVDNKAWCVFAMDHRISDIADSNGGSGKSIMLNVAVRNILLNNLYRDGRDTEVLKNKHIYEGITKDSDYVIFDDADSHFPFSKMFSNVTGDLPVNPKHGRQYVLPFSESPKFAITSNFGLFKADSSTNRRILYTVFSDYYHYKSDDDKTEWSPVHDFGKTLFSQFDEKEWSDFFNVSAEALQFYLGQDDKINPPLGNVEKRNSLQTMGDAFKDWADTYFSKSQLDTLIPKNEAFNDFEIKTKLKKWSSQRFKKALKEWCKYYGYEMNPEEVLNSQGRCIHNYNGTTVEMIYIKAGKIVNLESDDEDDFFEELKEF